MKFQRVRFYASLNILFVLGAICSCTHETGPTRVGEVTNTLKWTPRYSCIDGALLGVYYGSLELNGLSEGEKFKVYFKDSLVSESVAGSSGTESVELENSQPYHIPEVKLIFRNDTLRLSSSDSLSVGAGRHPFPLRLSITADKITNGVTAEFKKLISLLVSDTLYTRIRCRMNLTEGWVIVPDTIKYNATSFRLYFLADTYGNDYRVVASYLDSTSLSHMLFDYDAYFGSGMRRLERSEFNFASDIPNLPAMVTFFLDIGMYKIRFEKEPE